MLPLLHSLFELMVKHMEILSLQEGSAKGTLLSPYLFVLCVEGFTSLLSKAEAEGRLYGVQICKRVPCISNLLFVDDSLISARQIKKKCS